MEHGKISWSEEDGPESSDGKRKRSRNFTPAEELELVNLVVPRKNVIENKKSDAATWKEKERAWYALSIDFCRNTGETRSPISLRAKYETLKKKAKVKMAEERATGKKEIETKTVTDITQQIIGIIEGSQIDNDSINRFDEDDDEVVEEMLDDLETNDCGDELNTDHEDPLYKMQPKLNRTSSQSKHGMKLQELRRFFNEELRRANEKHQKEMELLEKADLRAQQRHEKEMEMLEREDRRARQRHERAERRAEQRHEWEEGRHEEEMQRIAKEKSLLDLKILCLHRNHIPSTNRNSRRVVSPELAVG